MIHFTVVGNIRVKKSLLECDFCSGVIAEELIYVKIISGVYRGGYEVLATAKLVLPSPEEGVTMQLTVRSENPDVSELLTQVVG